MSSHLGSSIVESLSGSESDVAVTEDVGVEVAKDVSDWIATPALLNEKKCGETAILSGRNAVVQRHDADYSPEESVCYTYRPLPLGRVWQITIVNTSRRWRRSGLMFGVTAKIPDAVPCLLIGSDSGPQDWIYDGNYVWNNGNVVSRTLYPHLSELGTKEKVGIMLSEEGNLHVCRDGKLDKNVVSTLPVKTPLWGVVDVYGRCAKIKSELLSDPAKFLQEALKDGFIPHKDDLFLIHGPGGVGKSSLIAMFIGQQRDLNRASTAVAEESLHLCPVRDVSTSMFTDKWELVDINRQARMVAHTSHHLLTSEGVQRVEISQNIAQAERELAEEENEATEIEPFLVVTAPPTPPVSHSQETQPPAPTVGGVSLLASLPPIPNEPESSPTQSKKEKFSQFASKFWQKIKLLLKKQSPQAANSNEPPSQQEPQPTEENEEEEEEEEEEIMQQEGAPPAEGEVQVHSTLIKDEGVQSTKEEVQVCPLVSTLGDDPDNIEGLLDNFQGDLHDIIWKSRESKELILYYSIRLLDSGGQPQFHEVVSIILPAVTGIVSVFKLSEPLDVHGEVVFYKDGVLANDPYKSYLTNEQVIRHDLLAIQSEASHSGVDEMPSLAFVGTHLDLQHTCPDETPNQKDDKLHSMITEILPENMQECVISNGESLQQAIFRVNARTPSNSDYKTAGRLKGALMKQSRVKPRNLPLKWCSYEVALRKLMTQLGRHILSLKECEFVGHKLGFDSLSLKACLHYLSKYHIISFYDILPNVIFGSSQVILDKITELVTYSLELKKGNRALDGDERKFHQQGILSLKILQSESCSKHYRGKQFTPEDLLKILKSLLIITNVGVDEYLLPCVLEVSDIYPSPPPPEGTVRSSFSLHFSKKSPMIGIYCCAISYLLSEAGWSLLKENGKVVQVSRNSVAFELPLDFPGKLTFVDPLSSYLEVVVQLPALIAADDNTPLYKEIHHVFIKAMRQAMQTLNYEVRTPELSFLCPGQSSECSAFPHLAKVNHSRNFLTCSLNPRTVTHRLSSDQKMWLQTTSNDSREEVPGKGLRTLSVPPIKITSEKPTLPELLKLKIPLRVRDKYEEFGVFLLKDKTGDKMGIIKDNCGRDAEGITRTVLAKWLGGAGEDPTWENLISALKESDLSFLAHQIEIARVQV